MPFTTYAELKTEMTNWLGNSLNSDQYDEFITLFERAAIRRLRVRETTTTATITMTDGSGSLPSDFIAAKRVTWTGTPSVELEYAHPTWIRSAYPSTDEGTPQHYSIEGANIIVRPASDTSLQMLYVEKTDAVSGTLNWLYTNHYDCYLYGALCEAEAYASNDERAAFWKLRRDECFEEILRQDFNHRGPMQVRVHGTTP